MCGGIDGGRIQPLKKGMKPLSWILVLAVICFADPSGAADADAGKRLAERWCASCHLVSPGQQRASGDQPTFAQIGSRPGFDASRLALFLLEPHPKMPSMSLTRSEAADIAAYIGRVAATGK